MLLMTKMENASHAGVGPHPNEYETTDIAQDKIVQNCNSTPMPATHPFVLYFTLNEKIKAKPEAVVLKM